ncbi:orotidine-5'-phosphate decarboxylase [Trueperella pecoris]|uniref:orotidine-5'-phosphate decarboxylase n=1 Tax=Trueperella pecoris TaxID=2733571 RepID=UPI00186B75B6|nr:orotidine-5'-phosphate decarboxylase [Trueperella pecoris]QOQ39521.1 orotidine-5'-phosphate decarboxylase [Trueperella pecoris]QTG75686.1 orotidine-5'-phosphate decarboxylase [Trueperella pecoris]
MKLTAGGERVIVALDLSEGEALALADTLPRGAWVKVGMTLFYATGPRIVTELKDRGFKVFLDLKLHDIPHQVRQASAVLGRLGADLLTVHAAGGADMIRAAREGLASAGATSTAILAVTVLTSMDEATLASIGVERDLPAQVAALARASYAAGADGVVCSPLEAPHLRGALGPEALIVTPGVRPPGAQLGDQSRVATPAAAVAGGASHVVVGRPITAADEPARAFTAISTDIDSVLYR